MEDDKMVVEQGMSSEVMDRIKRMGEEKSDSANVTLVNSSGESIKDEVLQENKDDKSAEIKGGLDGESDSGNDNGDDSSVLSDSGKDDVDEKPQTFKVMLHGKERSMTENDIKSAMGKLEKLQKLGKTANDSEEMKLGTLTVAAKNGDKGAQKKLRDMLKTSLGDDDMDDLDDVTTTFDEDSALQDSIKEDEFEVQFLDVKDGVDFKDNMAKIENELKAKMPLKVWESYFEAPETRRTLYDLVASGRMDELLTQLEDALATLPINKQIEVETNPELYGQYFMTVLKRSNAELSKAGTDTKGTGDDGDSTDDGLDSVSTGKKGRASGKDSKPEIDWANMTKEEFRAEKSKRFGAHSV